MAICRSWRSEIYDGDDDNVDSTVVVADNAGELDVSTVLCEVVSVSDGIVMGARLTAVSMLVALDANSELLASDGNPEVADPRKGSQSSSCQAETTLVKERTWNIRS